MNTPSEAAQVIVTIIPIVGIVFGFVAILMYLLLQHKQRILMIEKGLFKSTFDMDNFSLFTGLILLFIGLVLLIFFLLKEGLTYAMLSGLMPLAVGISFLTFFIIRLKVFNKKNEGRKIPG
jgi:hypothetical protein